MPDNISSPIASGQVLATDEIAGVHYPRSKMTYGADGSATDVSSTNPLPVVNPRLAPEVWSTPGTGRSFVTLQTLKIQVTGTVTSGYTPQVSGLGTDYANWVVYDRDGNALTSITAPGVYTMEAGSFIRLTGGAGGTFAIWGN